MMSRISFLSNNTTKDKFASVFSGGCWSVDPVMAVTLAYTVICMNHEEGFFVNLDTNNQFQAKKARRLFSKLCRILDLNKKMKLLWILIKKVSMYIFC